MAGARLANTLRLELRGGLDDEYEESNFDSLRPEGPTVEHSSPHDEEDDDDESELLDLSGEEDIVEGNRTEGAELEAADTGTDGEEGDIEDLLHKFVDGKDASDSQDVSNEWSRIQFMSHLIFICVKNQPGSR